MDFIKNQEWRYATKKFDASKKISANHLADLKKAIQLSASSYGLQLYKVLIIEDSELRSKLKEASWNQSQITDASQLFVFCAYDSVKTEHIDEFIALTAKTRNLKEEDLQGYGDFMKNTLGSFDAAHQLAWAQRQTYIALGNLLAAAAELRIDACPMEGFEPEKYNEILGLKEKGLCATVLATAGYRSEEDVTQSLAKVRRPDSQLFETI